MRWQAPSAVAIACLCAPAFAHGHTTLACEVAKSTSNSNYVLDPAQRYGVLYEDADVQTCGSDGACKQSRCMERFASTARVIKPEYGQAGALLAASDALAAIACALSPEPPNHSCEHPTVLRRYTAEMDAALSQLVLLSHDAADWLLLVDAMGQRPFAAVARKTTVLGEFELREIQSSSTGNATALLICTDSNSTLQQTLTRVVHHLQRSSALAEVILICNSGRLEIYSNGSGAWTTNTFRHVIRPIDKAALDQEASTRQNHDGLLFRVAAYLSCAEANEALAFSARTALSQNALKFTNPLLWTRCEDPP